MTHDRIKALFTKGQGWAYNVGGWCGLSPDAAQSLIVHSYGLDFRTAREKLAHARKGAVVSLPPRERQDAGFVREV